MIRTFFHALSFAAVMGMVAGCKATEPVLTAQTSQVSSPQETLAPPVIQAPVWNPKRPNYQPAETRVHDLLHTRLALKFDWAKQHVLGEATLTVKPYFYPQQELVLDARGFDINGVFLVTKETEKKLAHTYDGRKLRITLDKTYTRNDTYQVLIDYTAKPNEFETTAGEAITSDKGLYFINPLGSEPDKPRQIWTQGETESNSAWFPTIDSPNERMTQDVYVTVDAKYVTLSNGTLVYSRNHADGTRTDYWKQEQPHAPYLVMVAVGDFAVVKDKWRNLEVNYYVEPAYKDHAKAIFGNTPEMMEFFSKKLGVDYPWAKYSQIVVRDYVSGAMENTSASVFMEALQMTKRELLDKSWDDIIAHELFHQWFGDLVTAESWANLPLNEAFANYAPFLWAEHKKGADAAAFNLQEELGQYLAESETKQVPIIRYHYQDPLDMFDSHSYAKGGLVLHMLRQYVGDEAFFASLNRYLSTHKFTAVEIDELRMAFEEVTGEDLNWFFDQWFLSAGHPNLEVQHAYQDGTLSLQVHQQQDTLSTPVYRLPLQVAVWSGGKKTVHQVVVNQARQTFAWPLPSAPDLVLFDAEQQLVGEVNHPKTNQELLYQYRNAGPYRARFEALAALAEKRDEPQVLPLFQEALKDPFWNIRVQALVALAKYEGPQAESVRRQVQELAQKDPESHVRATAITTLSSFGGQDYTSLYLQALHDQSYLVTAAAVNAYGTARKAAAKPEFGALETSDNAHLVNALAGYYVVHGDEGKYQWYLRKLNKLNGIDLYYFLQNMGGYMSRLPEAQKAEGTQRLAKIAMEHPTYYVRYAAYQALTMASESPAVQQLRQQVREGEKDPRLQQVYSNSQ